MFESAHFLAGSMQYGILAHNACFQQLFMVILWPLVLELKIIQIMSTGQKIGLSVQATLLLVQNITC